MFSGDSFTIEYEIKMILFGSFDCKSDQYILFFNNHRVFISMFFKQPVHIRGVQKDLSLDTYKIFSTVYKSVKCTFFGLY